jgi:hypothetical protein
VCLDQNKTSCTKFDFLALYQAEGLDDIDGVLGLAVHPDKDSSKSPSYVHQLKQKGLIERGIVSFSIAGPNIDDKSFAIFGGIDENQIVGGVNGLKKMQTMAYRPDWTESAKQWALEGQTVFYGEEEMQKAGHEKKFPAIVDTGSMNLGVPGEIYNELKGAWMKNLPKIDCMTDDNFCQVMTPCKDVEKKLSPISF